MKLGIAGYGNIGRYIEGVFAPHHDIAVFDPPKGLGCVADMDRCDFVFICVPTPPAPDGSCDTSVVEQVVATLSPRAGFVCSSTVAIGTTERLRERYGKPLVYVPEYAGEAPDHPYRNIENRTFFILGGRPEDTAAVEPLLASAYGQSCRFWHVPPRVAEVVKYMENAFLALKVTFCNEFYDLCAAVGVDYELVRRLWLEDARIGSSHTLVTPERGFGGMCLPKDTAAVCRAARQRGIGLELLETALRVNDRIRRVAATETAKAARP